MAHGDLQYQTRHDRLVLFVDSAVATADGVWIDSAHYTELSLTLSGVTTAAIQVRGSDDLTKPANSTHGQPVTVALTTGTTAAAATVNVTNANGSMYVVGTLPRWVKVQVTAWTTGTLVCYGLFRSQSIG